VLLEPKKGTQGREMKRIIRIALALAPLVALSASAPTVASAGSPLLSGYGGPGAGEQVIVGSTLLIGARGGAGSGGSSGSGGSAGASQGGSGASPPNGSRATLSGAGSNGGSIAGNRGGGSQARGALRAGRGVDPRTGRANANPYVYPAALRSASTDSPLLGISGGDMLLLIATIVTLVLTGVLTIRLTRLQR
jgi:hypothetical protein